MVNRYRLRFLLQEFDLIGPDVVLGRSPACHITIDDPLMSRRHAKIRVSGPTIEDLGSRNGVRVNGELISGPTVLETGARIRLGSQELVFYVVSGEERSVRMTGAMTVCVRCDTPFPDAAPSCRHCGAPREEETMTGVAEEPAAFAYSLISEVVERALSRAKVAEADRLMQRAASELARDTRVEGKVLPTDAQPLCLAAAKLAVAQGTLGWVRWSLSVHRAVNMLPSDEFLSLVTMVSGSAPHVAELLAWAEERDNAGDTERFRRLQQAVHALR